MEFRYPYTDFHELNLDWFLGKFKELVDEWNQLAEDNAEFKTELEGKFDTLDHTVQEFTTFVTNYFNNLDVQQEINNKLDAMAADGTLSALLQPMFDELVSDVTNSLSSQNGRITQLESRMDSFSHLAEGSTTGDAELIDARTDYNGVTHDNAGDCIRYGQMICNGIQNIKLFLGYIKTNFTINTLDANRWHTDYLYIGENVSLTYSGETNNANILGICFYDKDKLPISGLSNNEATPGTPVTVTTPIGTCYCRISTKIDVITAPIFKPAYGQLGNVNDKIESLLYDIDGYIPFTVTSPSARSDQYTSLSGIREVHVTDPDYRVVLYYDNGDHHTGWQTDINLTLYDDLSHLQLKKTDESNLDARAIRYVCKMIRDDSIVEYDTVSHLYSPCYVDCDNGSDSNTGFTRGSALATISKAISLGYKNIVVKPGTYSESVLIKNATDVTIKPDTYYYAFNSSTNYEYPLIILDVSASYALKIENSYNINIECVKATNSDNGFVIDGCNDVVMLRCVADGCANGQGFDIDDSNITCNQCECVNIGTMGGGQHHDGFNIHGFGRADFFDCKASYCEDDGISHHDGTVGYIHGGEWHHCGKAGIASPTEGSIINIDGAYVHDCEYGIYAVNVSVAEVYTINVSNCALKDNNTADIRTYNYILNTWNTIYSTTQINGSGVINVIA